MKKEAFNWREQYASKIVHAEAAARLIPAGHRILIGSGAAEPVSLVRALAEHATHLSNNEIVHLLTLGPAPYSAHEHADRFRHTAFFIGPNVRDAVREGRADFMPVFLSDIPELIRSRRVRIDVALIQVSPPNEHGYVSLGVSVDIVRAAVDSAALIIAEVNPNVPWTHGDSFVHVSRLARLVPSDAPLLERIPEPSDPVTDEIGRHIAKLVPDGATLQLGIGRIPDAVLAQLGNHVDLGVHTEMFSDGVMKLVDAGVINGRRKTLLAGKLVTSFVMGTRRLYEWVDGNPAVEMRPTEFTNDPFTIARNERMISINACLAVDLTGQVAADTLGGNFFSGIGGQVDFVRGASRSRGGKSILALPSTAKKGTVSRILPALAEGTGVVTSRGDVRYVVTEYGVADLWGKNIRERANALIGIAHPDFRGELLAQAKARHYVFPDQVLPRATYPFSEARVERLQGGERLTVRPPRLTDERAVTEFLYKLSDESLYRRFLAYKKQHPHEEVQQLVSVDFEDSMALVACIEDTDEIIGLSRYDVDPATRMADVAFVVRDDWQRRGVGTVLMHRMTEVAKARGLAGFEMDVLSTNRPMLKLVTASGLKVSTILDAGVYHLKAKFGPGPATLAGSIGAATDAPVLRGGHSPP